MAEIRELWLINRNGDKYDLNVPTHFLNNPTGFGFRKSYSATQLGNSEKITDEIFQMVDVSGEIIFNRDGQNEFTYQEYDEFVDFIKFKPLELHYRTVNKVFGYYAEIVITALDKDEIKPTDSALRCPITFHRSTQWKNDNITRLVFAKIIESGGKHYNYHYNYHYAGSNFANMTPITNNGTEDCPLVFEVVCPEGETVENPVFTLFQDGAAYAQIKLLGEFSYVRIDTDRLSESIYLEDEDGTPVPAPSNAQDFASFSGELYYTFIQLKVGDNTGVFTCGNIDTFNGEIKLTYEENRASS